MTPEKIREIARKYLGNTATKEEEDLLHQYYNEVDSETTETVVTENPTDAVKTGAEMLAAIRGKMEFALPVGRRRLWPKVAAAAAVIVLLTGICVSLFLNSKDQQQFVQKLGTSADLLPGKNGAVLTTASGLQIILDNEEDGIIASEGNVLADKHGTQLSYDVQSNILNTKSSYHTLTTPKGRQFQLVLSDGTKVWLNAASSITYPTHFSGKERKVEITGEAFFEVAHKGGAMPFVVKRGDIGVTVLGTQFNINAYDDEESVKVTLLEGSVQVSLNTPGSAPSVVRLKPGQQAECTRDTKLLTHNHIDPIAETAWKNGRFSFREASIADIMRQVSRWYDAEVVFEGNVKNEYFSGEVPRFANASTLLNVLETTNTVKFDIRDGKIIVYPVK